MGGCAHTSVIVEEWILDRERMTLEFQIRCHDCGVVAKPLDGPVVLDAWTTP